MYKLIFAAWCLLTDILPQDVIFNAGSIAFPISECSRIMMKARISCLTPIKVGFYAGIWWLDALGGLLLSFVVIYNWSSTSAEHIKNLCGFSATADQRNIREISQNKCAVG
jgi:hypothetical protein